MPGGAAALKADFGVRQAKARGEGWFDKDLADAGIGGQMGDQGSSPDCVSWWQEADIFWTTSSLSYLMNYANPRLNSVTEYGRILTVITSLT